MSSLDYYQQQELHYLRQMRRYRSPMTKTEIDRLRILESKTLLGRIRKFLERPQPGCYVGQGSGVPNIVGVSS